MPYIRSPDVYPDVKTYKIFMIPKRIHFIDIGERIVHDLATALREQGHTVTSSEAHNIGEVKQLDCVIVGSGVPSDNAELQIARQLTIPIHTYPEYIYQCAQDKQRIVVAGGKDTIQICLLVMHVLAYYKRPCDFVIDTPKLATSTQLSDAPVMLLAGSEAPSPIDGRPQFLGYRHNIALLSGVNWQASAAYPTLDTYREALTALADATPKGGILLYAAAEELLATIAQQPRQDVNTASYTPLLHNTDGVRALPHLDATYLSSLPAAQLLLSYLAVKEPQFYEAMATFGAPESSVAE